MESTSEDDPASPESSGQRAHRGIRSFVLRQGRMSPAQARALDTLLPKYGIEATTSPLDYASVFGRVAPVTLEIGFGMGDATAHIASAHPDRDFIGIEVHGPGVGRLLNRIDAMGLENLRVIRHDAVAVVRDMIAPASLAAIHVFFPDPWPKKRHHKRRLMSAAFVAELASRLEAGGYLHVASDWQDYAIEMLATLDAETLLQNTSAGFADKPAWRPRTRFETRGLAKGHAVYDLLFRRRR
jgi:tRNA (guanine-N7-)-methyltransferase